MGPSTCVSYDFEFVQYLCLVNKRHYSGKSRTASMIVLPTKTDLLMTTTPLARFPRSEAESDRPAPLVNQNICGYTSGNWQSVVFKSMEAGDISVPLRGPIAMSSFCTASPSYLAIHTRSSRTGSSSMATSTNNTSSSSPQEPTSILPETAATAATATSSESTQEPSGSGLLEGAKIEIGVGIGIFASALLILAAIWFWWYRKRAAGRTAGRDKSSREGDFGTGTALPVEHNYTGLAESSARKT
ncbi:hypothetical protein Q7P35_007012 [Cladosporium inversicolor]